MAHPALAGGQRSASVPALHQASPPLCLRQVCSAKRLKHCGGGSDGHMPLIGAVARSAADGGRSALSSTRHPQGLQNPAHPQGERGLTWPPGAVPGARAAARRDQQLARRRPQWMGILRRLLLRLLDGFQVLRSGGGGGGDTESETGGAQRRHKHDVDNTGSEKIIEQTDPWCMEAMIIPSASSSPHTGSAEHLLFSSASVPYGTVFWLSWLPSEAASEVRSSTEGPEGGSVGSITPVLPDISGV